MVTDKIRDPCFVYIIYLRTPEILETKFKWKIKDLTEVYRVLSSSYLSYIL